MLNTADCIAACAPVRARQHFAVDSATAARLIALDKQHLWHPFTQMQEWCAPDQEPLLITRADGVWLWDQHGRKYLDGNSSIWTNIHGHGHPTITGAIARQLQLLDHASFLGQTNEPAIRLAEKLCSFFPGKLERVFFSDDGSTAVECALKMALQYWQMSGHPERCEFLAFHDAYHGDTLGAAALGGIPLFHGRFQHLGFRVHHAAGVEALNAIDEALTARLAGVVVEPLIQGAAGMRTWPEGMLRTLRQWCDWHGLLLIFDEVMTGFGRTGTMFACQQEGVTPDFLALAKGLTGGTLPLAATLTTTQVFSAFLGRPEERKTFFHGHSYCGNPLACAAALGSLEVFAEDRTLETLPEKIALLTGALASLQAAHPRHVSAIRQCGMIAGIDVVTDAESGVPFPWQEQTGARICRAAQAHGLLTRPIRDTLVLMPPLAANAEHLSLAVEALSAALREVLG